MGRLERIWIKRAKGGPMDPAAEADLDTDGLVGNANRGGHRAVTLIARERWAELMDELGVDLDPSVRRANLLLSGIDLVESRGKSLRIGDCVLQINGETRPCNLMDETHMGLQEAMRSRWGGGAFATVVTPGPLRVGDAVAFEG